MLYGKSEQNTRLEGLPGSEWGAFDRYLEIGSDGFATRQVDVYENGFVLRYDRQHYVDSYGMLADLRHSENWEVWWPNSSEIDEHEFEKVWKDAALSEASTLQKQSDRPDGLPETPPWLKR